MGQRVRVVSAAGAVALLAALLAFAGCGRESSPAPPPHLVIALIDTLRRDHLGAYGHPRDTTPFIDELARSGTRFERVIAQAPWTGASMASLWTSRLPSEVGGLVLPDAEGVQELGRTPLARLRRDVPTLAEQLAAAGYRTRAFVANAYAGRSLGLLRGFASSLERPLDAAGLVDAALARAREDLAGDPDGPLLLYLHFRDVHEPLEPPAPYRSLFPGPPGTRRDASHARWRHGDAPDPRAPEVQAFREHKRALYDGALRFVDDELRRLASGLAPLAGRRGLVFAVASDHGEAFWDHADWERRVHRDPRGIAGIGHGHSLFAELLEVPLVLSGPGVPQARVSAPVRNLDLAPTLLGLAGLPPAPGMRGIDLLAALREGRLAPLPGFSENIAYGPEARSLSDERFKWIRYSDSRRGPTEVWIDRSADPREQPRSDAPPSAALPLRERLAALEAELGTLAPPAEPARLDPAVREQLRALGYER